MSIPIIPGRRFMLGKYEIIAQPIPHSSHMLRYTVFVDGRRIGALASVPTESDCRFLESPPPVPPLRVYSAAYRPGRPKGRGRPAARPEAGPPPPREAIPAEVNLPDPRLAEER